MTLTEPVGMWSNTLSSRLRCAHQPEYRSADRSDAGLSISAGVYVALHYLSPVASVNQFVQSAPPAGVLMAEYRERWDDERDVDVESIVEGPKP